MGRVARESATIDSRELCPSTGRAPPLHSLPSPTSRDGQPQLQAQHGVHKEEAQDARPEERVRRAQAGVVGEKGREHALKSEEEEPPMDPLECVLSLPGSARCLPAVCPLPANRRCSCLVVLLFEPDALISRWSEGGLR